MGDKDEEAFVKQRERAKSAKKEEESEKRSLCGKKELGRKASFQLPRFSHSHKRRHMCIRYINVTVDCDEIMELIVFLSKLIDDPIA